ncbi:ZBED5 protein, partial [Polyodon spathula]|nr:ZBED5 protein [Polyodon spathula]
TKHEQHKDKPPEFFKLEQLMASKKVLCCTASDDNIKAFEASCFVSYRVAKSGNPHTIAEELIVPAATDMVTTMFGVKAQKLIQLGTLSKSSVTSLNSRIFSILCNEMESKHVNLLLHTEVR